MRAHITARYYWVNVGQSITDHIRKFKQCTRVKGYPAKKRYPKQKLFPARYPFEMPVIDVAAFPKSDSGYEEVLAMIDRLAVMWWLSR